MAAAGDNVLKLPGPRTWHVLRDGAAVAVRAVTPGDEPGLRRLLDGASEQAIRLRFFGTPNLERAARVLAAVAEGDVALVAEAGGRVVGHAACLRTGADRAEVAFLVADAWQGLGLGRLLLREIAERAARTGVVTLTAEVLGSNHRMLSVFGGSGLAPRLERAGAGVSVRLSTAPAAVPPTAGALAAA